MEPGNNDRSNQYAVGGPAVPPPPPPYTDPGIQQQMNPGIQQPINPGIQQPINPGIQQPMNMQPSFHGSPYNAGYDQSQDPKMTGYPPTNPYMAGYDQPPRPMSPPIQTGSTFTNVVVTQQPSVIAVVPPNRPTSWMAPAIVVCLCCFWPTGICAIIAASMAESHADAGNMEDARKAANVAKWLTIASIIIPFIIVGILLMIFYI